MKVTAIRSRLKFTKTALAGTRLSVVLVLAVVIVGSAVSVSAYMMNAQKKKEPVVEKRDNKPTTPTKEAESEKPAVIEEEPEVTASVQPSPTQTVKPAANPVVSPAPTLSPTSAFTACTQKYSELYVKYNEDNASLNAEKSLALAVLDELYNSGFYDEEYPGDTEPYNQWQADRAELEADYNDQLTALYNAFAAASSPYLNC